MKNELNINHVYELYPLYEAIYGAPLHNKCFGALTACIAVERWIQENNVTGVLNVLELFAGNGEHKFPFLQQFKSPNTLVYKELDLYGTTDMVKGTIKGDALTYNYKHHNVILAYYYSLATTFIQGNVDARKQLDLFTQNLYNTMSENSCAFFHISDATIQDSFNFCARHHHTEVPLYINHSLLQHLGYKNITGYLTLKSERYYDRFTCSTIEHIEYVNVYVEDRLVKTITVKEPFIQRLWQETEIVDSFRLAGFKNIDFYRNILGYTEEYNKLSPEVHSSDVEDTDVESLMATEILVYK